MADYSYIYVSRGEELLRIDQHGEIETLQQNTIQIEDGSYQWFYYWKSCEVVSYERFQELKQAEEKRTRELYEAEAQASRKRRSELPF